MTLYVVEDTAFQKVPDCSEYLSGFELHELKKQGFLSLCLTALHWRPLTNISILPNQNPKARLARLYPTLQPRSVESESSYLHGAGAVASGVSQQRHIFQEPNERAPKQSKTGANPGYPKCLKGPFFLCIVQELHWEDLSWYCTLCFHHLSQCIYPLVI